MSWTVHGERVAYDDPHLQVTMLDVEAPNGDRFRHPVVVGVHPTAVTAVVDDHRRVLMVHRYRYVVSVWGWELPGGLVDSGEDPAGAAVREVIEETGWRPRRLERLLSYHPMPGMIRADQHLFLGADPEYVGPPTDPEEGARVSWIPLADAPRLVSAGEILGAGSLVGLLHLLAIGH